MPLLDFNRERLAYFFDQLKKQVDLTPVMSLINRLGDDLKALGLRFPVANLLDRLTPDILENFKFPDIFPDFGGLKLEKLFPGLKFPSFPDIPGGGNSDRVKVRHGIDKQAQRAWLRVMVDVPLTEKATVFSFGPIELKLANARFTAVSMISVELGSAPKLKTEGQIAGDWELHIAGTHLVTFRETALLLDDRKRISFRLSPEKIDLRGALTFITDLLRKFGPVLGNDDEKKPFTIRKVEMKGLPVGVEAVLDLPLPPVQLGVFGISGMRLGSTFRVLVLPASNGIDFVLGATLSLAQKEEPFTLTILILGGGGWFDARVSYHPFTNRPLSDITIGITASAMLAFSLGPVKGSVAIYFGVSAELHVDSSASNTFTLAIMLLLTGEVRVLSLVSVSISLLLEAEYNSTGSLVGRGTLKIRIKICWCFTFKFSRTVQYTFKKGSGADAPGLMADLSALSLELAGAMDAAADDEFDLAAMAYLAIFE